MALYKYTGPYDEVEVRIAGNDVGVVKKGESIVISDDLEVSNADLVKQESKPKEDPKPAPITSEGTK